MKEITEIQAKVSRIKRDLHSNKYRQRVVPNKKKKISKTKCRKDIEYE